MSPRWRDEIAIHLAPRKLALLRCARGLGGRVAAAIELDLPGGAGAEVGPALARLSEVLAEPAWQDAAVRVVVADHPWARWAVVPWPSTRLDAAGRLAHARWVLGDAHGEAVADWTVALADTPPGRPSVACAMPATLRGALQEALAPARLRLVSLRPRLAVAFETWRRRLPADGAWFVRLDEGALSAVHLRRGAWDRIHVARLAPDRGDWRVELERLEVLGRLTRADGAPGRVLVDAPKEMRPAGGHPPESPGVEWLEERGGGGGHELALLARAYA